MNIDQLIQLATLLRDENSQPSVPQIGQDLIGKYCIVRTYSAGVIAGVLKSRNGREAEITEARQIWMWTQEKTLKEVAVYGVRTDAKVSRPAPMTLVTEAIEFLPCTLEAEKSLRNASWAK